MKPYYEQDGITIYHGDCREILPSLSADVLITDPPYGVGKAAWDSAFDVPWDLFGIASPVVAVMPGVCNLLSCPREFGSLVYRWSFSAHLVNGMTRGHLGFGNWIPVLVWSQPGVSLYQKQSDCRAFAVGCDMKPDHPSPKPLNVMLWFLSRLPGAVTVDPFMGSGTTLVAAKRMGRCAIGIEIEERYCEIAVRRLAQSVMFSPPPPERVEQMSIEL